MEESSMINNTNVEITDVEMFALIGQKDIEIFIKDKTLERLNKQFDKMRNVLVELETANKRVSVLELTNSELNNNINKLSVDSGKYEQLLLSNKSLSEMNIKLDTALTDERHKLKDVTDKCAQLNNELGELKNVKYNKSKKRNSNNSTNP